MGGEMGYLWALDGLNPLNIYYIANYIRVLFIHLDPD